MIRTPIPLDEERLKDFTQLMKRSTPPVIFVIRRKFNPATCWGYYSFYVINPEAKHEYHRMVWIDGYIAALLKFKSYGDNLEGLHLKGNIDYVVDSLTKVFYPESDQAKRYTSIFTVVFI